MDRGFAIALGLSVAAHLSLGGLSGQDASPAAIHQPTLSLVLEPTRVASSEPTPVQPEVTQPVPEPQVSEPPVKQIIPEPVRQTRNAPQPIPAPEQQRPATRPAPEPVTVAMAEPAPVVEKAEIPREQLHHGLHRLLETHFYYPRLARRQGLEGTVRIGLHIAANGEISQVRIIEGSGHGLLDSAALKSAHRIRVFEEAQQLLGGRELDMIMPVKFRLMGS